MPDLQSRVTEGASVTQPEPGHWQLSIPPGPAGVYRWAQLDDYIHLPRSRFNWQPPFTLWLRARISAQEHSGTWGFGFWNDPFSLSLGMGGGARRLPVLPNAAWFFFASPPSHLALRKDLPGSGMLAGVFSAPPIPSLLLAPGALALPLALSAPTAPLLRSLLCLLVKESSVQLDENWSDWHLFELEISPGCTRFALDGKIYHETEITPRGQLGLVIWVDNQFLTFPPYGRVRAGMLESKASCSLEICMDDGLVMRDWESPASDCCSEI